MKIITKKTRAEALKECTKYILKGRICSIKYMERGVWFVKIYAQSQRKRH